MPTLKIKDIKPEYAAKEVRDASGNVLSWDLVLKYYPDYEIEVDKDGKPLLYKSTPAQDYRLLENIVENDPNGPYAATKWLLGQQVALPLGALGVVTAPAAITVGGIAGGVGGDILGNYASDWLFNNPDKEYKLNQDITITPREASGLAGSIIGGGLGGYGGYAAANTGRNYSISRELNRAVKEFDGTVGDSYFHAPDRFYRITSSPEIHGLLELGMNVTTRDLSTMPNQADAFRTLVLNKGLVPGKGELEGYWIYPENIRKGALQKRIKEELGINSSRFNLDENPSLFVKRGSAHGNRTLAGWLEIWEGSTINDPRFPHYILEGHPLQNLTIPYGKRRSYFIDTPIDKVPRGARVGFKTGEMPTEGLNKFRLLPNGRYLYEGPVLPDKRIVVNESVTKLIHPHPYIYAKKSGGSLIPKHQIGTIVLDKYYRFCGPMYHALYKAFKNVGKVSENQAMLLARYATYQMANESGYGTSRLARELHNYGGMKNGNKGWQKFNSMEDFANQFVRNQMKNFKETLGALNYDDYIDGLFDYQYLYAPDEGKELYNSNLQGVLSRVDSNIDKYVNGMSKFYKPDMDLNSDNLIFKTRSTIYDKPM